MKDNVELPMTIADFRLLRRLAFEQVMNFEDWHSSEHQGAERMFERVFQMTVQEYIDNVRDR